MKILLRVSVLVLLSVAIYAFGFFLFVITLPRPVSDLPHADGIVALTGGEARLDTAVSLLERHAADRLLITGVFETTSKSELARRFHGGRLFACCADIDYSAEDTYDNAIDAAQWTQHHDYHSLIVVTAYYHMPRSLAEFAAVMPGIRLVPYPVEPSGIDMSRWWSRPGTVHLLHQEYAKYLATLLMTSVRGKETKPAPHRAVVRGDAS